MNIEIIVHFKESITILKPPSIYKKAKKLKLQRPQNDQKLFPEIATTLRIEN